MGLPGENQIHSTVAVFVILSLRQTFLPFVFSPRLFCIVADECLASLVEGTVYLKAVCVTEVGIYWDIPISISQENRLLCSNVRSST